MSAQTMTVVSGVALLVVFVLVAWYLRRRCDRDAGDRAGKKD